MCIFRVCIILFPVINDLKIEVINDCIFNRCIFIEFMENKICKAFDEWHK